jgi:hypothetical protein
MVQQAAQHYISGNRNLSLELPALLSDVKIVRIKIHVKIISDPQDIPRFQ